MSPTLDAIFGLHGRTALVTGSSRGIGAAIAKGIAAAGATVVVHGVQERSATGTHEAICAAGGQAHAIAGDLAIAGAGRAVIADAEAAAGPLDILVINASAQENAELDALTQEDLRTQVDVNFVATLDMFQTCLPGMAARGWGRVVNIGSINQARPKSIVTAYAATKAAVHNVIQTQARAYAERGVLLNTLAPGLVDTDRNAWRKAADPAAWADYTETLNWMGRAGDPEEMVGAAIFLASDACSFMTGETVFLTGGS